MSQESNKEPVALEVGRVLVATVYIEKGSDPDCASELAPRYQALFLRASHARRASSADCRFIDMCARHTRPRERYAIAGRWRSHRTREAGRKKTEVRGANLFAHSNLLPFFVQPAPSIHAHKDWFSGELEGRFYLKSGTSIILPLLPAKKKAANRQPSKNQKINHLFGGQYSAESVHAKFLRRALHRRSLLLKPFTAYPSKVFVDYDI